jgi:glycosyltransferase involved in cell wall biosynthesis
LKFLEVGTVPTAVTKVSLSDAEPGGHQVLDHYGAASIEIAQLGHDGLSSPLVMNIVILTQYFPPETGAPQARLEFLAQRLSAAGHAVEIVTALPNYPAGEVLPAWRGKLVTEEATSSGRVLRSWLYTSKRRSTSRLLATYLTFAASAAVTAPFRLRRADLLLWESPPLSLAPVASLLARRLRARLIMNVSDLWPRSAVELGLMRNRRLVTLFYSLEHWSYRVADLVSCQTEGIAAGVLARRPGTDIHLFPNGVDTQRFRPGSAEPALRQQLNLEPDAFVVGYAGNFGRAQALEQLLDAAHRLLDVAPEVKLVLLGGGPRREALIERVRKLGLSNVAMVPSVPHERMPAVISGFDVAVVPLADLPVFEGARPSKMFELLAMGVPIVYCGRGEGARLAEASGCARVVPPEDPAALAAAVDAWRRLPLGERQRAGRRGQEFVARSYDRMALTETFIARLERLASRSVQAVGDWP